MKFDANGWLDVATKIDYSANSMSRQGYGIKYLCLHGTAGGASAQGVGQFFQSTVNGPNPVSSHIIIDQQGNVVQGVPMSLAAFGNGVLGTGHATYIPDDINPNLYTASIEFVKASTDNSDALTAIQFQKGCEVIECICDTYNIPKHAGDVNGGVIKHADIDPINRARCPGTLDFNALWAYLKGNSSMSNIPANWSDDGHTLYAPDKKFPIVFGFRGFILNPDNKWDPNDYPIEAEHGANPVEMSNVGLGAGSEQTYRMSRLGYTQGKIYKTWIGQELHWYQQQHTLLQDQLTQLLALNADLHEKLAELQADALAQENAALQDKIEQAVKDLS